MILGHEVRIKEFLSLCHLVELEDGSTFWFHQKKGLRANIIYVNTINALQHSRLLEKKMKEKRKVIEDPDDK